jgi:hypothetical protein
MRIHSLIGFVVTTAACGGSGSPAPGGVVDTGSGSTGGGSGGSMVTEPTGGNGGSAGPGTGVGGSAGSSVENGGGGEMGGAGGSAGTSSGSGGCSEYGALPSDAPALESGTWSDVSPEGFPFDPNTSTLGITIQPCNPAVLYVCTGSYSAEFGGLYKSENAGTSWTRIGHIDLDDGYSDHLDAPLHVVIDPGNTEHLYIAQGTRGRTGFWVSLDGGENVEMPQSFLDLHVTTDVYTVAAEPGNFDHVLLSFHSGWPGNDNGAGVAESTDGGATWVAHPPTANWGWGHSIHFLDNGNTWLLGTQGAGMWRTEDAGQTWTQVTTTNVQHGGGTLYRTKDGVWYAAGSKSNIRSADGGKTWTSIGGHAGYNGIYGDGTYLYTAPNFGPTPFWFAKESEPDTWSEYSDQQFKQGPFDMTFDEANGIMYASLWGTGLWALKVAP